MPQPASTYSITPMGVKYNGNPVTLIGTPVTPGGAVPSSNFPQSNIVTLFTRDFSEREAQVGTKDYGQYSVDATLVSIRSTSLPFGGIESIEGWQVDIKASPPNSSPKSQITAMIEVGTPAFFGYAIKADQSIDINCNGGGGGDDSQGDEEGEGGGSNACLV